MSRCEICRGARVVRLPLYRPVAVSSSVEPTLEAAEASYREFPCPECAPLVSADHVAVVEHFFQADARYEGREGYREHLIGVACNAIAHQIERGGFARLQSAPVDEPNFRRAYRVTVGVVSPKIVADIDKKREQAEVLFAEEVARIAIADIHNWGSYYGHWNISKERAGEFILEALTKAKQRRAR